tara:strand:+ start:31 stop:213 length:183 start_codon:yes stop_codon:yes gene_type:complete
VKKKIKKIMNIIFSESDKPKTFWISIPEYFQNEQERHRFIQRTINFVNRKTKTHSKTTYA